MFGRKGIGIIAAAAIGLIAVVGGLCWTMAPTAEERDFEKAKTLRSIRKAERQKKAAARRERRIRRENAVRIAPVQPSSDVNPTNVLLSAEEEKLTEEFKSILRELQKVLDSNDHEGIFRLCRNLQARMFAGEQIPPAVVRRMLQALRCTGSSGISEAIGFLGSGDPEVQQEVYSQVNDALMDFSLGDRAMADALVAVAKVADDADAMQSMYMRFDWMRNSVFVDAATRIMDTGSPVAKATLNEAIQAHTNTDEVPTKDSLQQWGKDNPDGEYDEQFYGPPQFNL